MELFLLSVIVFICGLLGIIFNRKNILTLLLSSELMLLGINLLCCTLAVFLDDIYGLILAIYVLTIAGAESAIGLALLVAYYRYRGTISVSFINLLHG